MRVACLVVSLRRALRARCVRASVFATLRLGCGALGCGCAPFLGFRARVPRAPAVGGLLRPLCGRLTLRGVARLGYRRRLGASRVRAAFTLRLLLATLGRSWIFVPSAGWSRVVGRRPLATLVGAQPTTRLRPCGSNAVEIRR